MLWNAMNYEMHWLRFKTVYLSTKKEVWLGIKLPSISSCKYLLMEYALHIFRLCADINIKQREYHWNPYHDTVCRSINAFQTYAFFMKVYYHFWIESYLTQLIVTFTKTLQLFLNVGSVSYLDILFIVYTQSHKIYAPKRLTILSYQPEWLLHRNFVNTPL